MARGLKIGGGILAVIVIAIVGVFIYIYSNLDSLVKDAVEDYGPRFTGVSVKLDKVELSPENGIGTLSGLIVGNPPGYSTDSAFRLGSISMALDIRSLTSDTIVIRSIEIDSPNVTYEFGEGGSNIDAIGKNVENAAGGPGEQTPQEESGSGKKMIVEHLVIRNGRVSVSHPLLKGERLGAALPPIELRDIGKGKPGGATPAEVVDRVMDAMERQVAAAVGSTDIENMLRDVTKGAEGAVRGVIGGAGGGVRGLEDATKGTGDTLKNLFGR